jgi:signal transduction histidine kinase
VKAEAGMPVIRINREQGRRIFTQLICNAARHSDPGSAVRVGYENGEFFIADRGCGICSNNLEKVFRIFFTTCSKESRHTGAGLFSVKKILELYGGEIRIESSPGQGTTVFFRLNRTG